MAVSKIYHVSVDIPESVWNEYGSTPEYDRRICAATEGHVSAGSNFYSQPEEWAEFTSLVDAEACDAKLHATVRYFIEKQVIGGT